MDIIVGPLIRLIMMAVELYIWLVLIWVIMSWLTALNVVNLHNRFVNMIFYSLGNLVEPALRHIRRVLPSMGNFDLSPVALIFLLIFAGDILRQVLIKFGV